ncbi:uncharacterized protein LOC121379710 isoform X2 [Gigantopelta aegis]|uniref:uncharacterized protein LOC121379710 isoform X2 n=1 Tax=Gigantopelta aegis TaxID=1735272 RepID=UPI001B88BDE8|nr:uncharacterized protein LOC121379710 isoform X2 [Gigantopelta aegis]
MDIYLLGRIPCQVLYSVLRTQSHLLPLLYLLWFGIADCRDTFYRKHKIPVPRFLPGPTNITVREGGMAVLPCSIHNLGTKKVAWRRYHEDHFLTIGKMVWIMNSKYVVDHKLKDNDHTSWNLLIKNVTPADAGKYECQITSTLDYTWHVQLNVVGPTGELVAKVGRFGESDAIQLLGKEFIEHGDPVHLVCNATGGSHIPEDIDWFKEGDKIDSEKYPDIITTKRLSLVDRSLISELIIDHSSVKDTGTYICRSSRDEIASKKVTVLIADTTNVKRGTGSLLSTNSSAWIPTNNNVMLSLFYTFTVTTLISGVIS